MRLQKVIESTFLTLLSRQIDDLRVSAARLKKRFESNQSAIYRLLGHDVAVENNIHLSAFKVDVLPFAQGSQTSLSVCASPIPDAEQCDATKLVTNSRISLFNSLGDKKGHLGVFDTVAGSRRDIDCHVSASRGLVFARFAVALARLVGP